MENDGIIRKIEHHTDWCSSIATSVKRDGSLRVCLDSKRLNDCLRRCPHTIPTLEELNPEFAGACVFSNMDAKSGYWSIHLDEISQELTTFRTRFGRYCYRRSMRVTGSLSASNGQHLGQSVLASQMTLSYTDATTKSMAGTCYGSCRLPERKGSFSIPRIA